jgi:hypothetical protein
MTLAFRLASVAVVGCAVAALVIQDHTGALPLGLFNSRRGTYAMLSAASLVVSLVALAVLIFELLKERLSGVARALRWLLAAVILLEVLFLTADKAIVSANSNIQVGGTYYERTLRSGEPVIFRKGNLEQTLRSGGEGSVVLMLGDSYTDGSGSGPECNYPDEVERTLRARWHPDARILNAGVAGFGPVESLRQLRWYLESGQTANAVVYTMFLENDVTDNLPGTVQRVVAGHLFRFPTSSFLRVFHPLNTRTFRWLLFMSYRLRVTHDLGDVVAGGGDGACNPHDEEFGEVTPFLRFLIDHRLTGSRRVHGSIRAQRELLDVLSAMGDEARTRGIAFFLVLFPDRALVDPELRERLDLGADDIAPAQALRKLIHDGFQAAPIVDASAALDGRTGMYRASDTHLSDRGNVVAGAFVGEALADQLATPAKPVTEPRVR